MASANIHYFTFLLEDLEHHVKHLEGLLKEISTIARNAGGICRVICLTSRYHLLKDLEKDIKSLNSLTQKVFMIASNAYDTNTNILEIFQNWQN